MSSPLLIHVHLLPRLVEPAELAGGIAVIIDQLRASTTICAALASGATAVVPVLEPDEAIRIRDSVPTGAVLTGGERHGLLISGFDLDNSPRRYTPERVRGRTIAFTTTNGTRAVVHAARAQRIVVGCLGNLSALVRTLAAAGLPVHVVCAGTNGRVASEDVFVAGAIVDGLLKRVDRGRDMPDTAPLDDSARLAHQQWLAGGASPARLLQTLRASQGGINLIEIDMHEDVEFCAQVDVFSIVPEWDHAAHAFTVVA